MEFAKFIFKFNIKMLPEFFNSYFTKLENVHKHFPWQIHRNKYYQFYTSESGKKLFIVYIYLNVRKNIPKQYRRCSFSEFKVYYRKNALLKYISQETLIFLKYAST